MDLKKKPLENASKNFIFIFVTFLRVGQTFRGGGEPNIPGFGLANDPPKYFHAPPVGPTPRIRNHRSKVTTMTINNVFKNKEYGMEMKI